MHLPGFSAEASLSMASGQQLFASESRFQGTSAVVPAQPWGGEIVPGQPCHCYGGRIWCLVWSRYSGQATYNEFGPCPHWPLWTVALPRAGLIA